MPSQQEIVDAVKVQLKKKDLSEQAVTVMKQATSNVLDRVKKNIDAQIKEDSSPIVEKFAKDTAAKMSAMTQQWVDGVTNDLVVFPEGTRYIWRDGQVTTIIVEQQPQVRHISYNKHIYLLAMPYVQFIIPFTNHVPSGKLMVGCTKKSLSDLDQPLLQLPLPNIQNHVVCMGDMKFPSSGNMTEMVRNLIGKFWQSDFNHNHHQANLDFINAMGWTDTNYDGMLTWQEKTKQDPMFIIGKDSKLKPDGTARRFFQSNSGDKGGSHSIVNNLKKEIITAIASIGGDVQKLLSSVDLDVENRKKTHVETLDGVLKEIIVQAYAELWEYMQKQLQDERVKLQKEMQDAANKLRTEFQQFMDQKKKAW
jgi:hypothetical protein